MGSSNTNIQDAVTRFKDYKEYLDSKMTSMDLVFLTSKEVARKLVEHGHRGTVLSRREFEQQKAASASATHYHRNQTTTLASSGCDIRDNFLRELAEREEANGTGKMTVIAALHPRRERRGSGSVWLFGLRPQTADPGLCAILQRQEEASARTPGFMIHGCAHTSAPSPNRPRCHISSGRLLSFYGEPLGRCEAFERMGRCRGNPLSAPAAGQKNLSGPR
ncbi:cilia- and flagella-associated protein 299 isoform 5-T5 [Syngnathus typhle]